MSSLLSAPLKSTYAHSLKQLLGVTGTPGTGKKSVAVELAALLGFTSKDLNVLARELGCAERIDDSVVVDTKRLSRALRGRAWSGVVFHGHLLPDLFRGEKRIDYVAVLRCDPSILKGRLWARGYRGDHLRENLEAELIGVSLSASLRSFGASRVREFDTSQSRPREVARAIAAGYKSRRSLQAGGWRDWTTHYDSPAALISLLSSSRTDSAFI